jgi:hypothetical protein
MKRNLICVGGAVAAMLLAAAANAAGTGAASLPTALAGTWGKTMTASTWTHYHIAGEKAGHFALGIDSGGITHLYYGLDPTQTKKVIFPFTSMGTTARGDTVTFGPTTDGFCPAGATYTWAVSGGKLSFKLVKDGCDARRVLMTVGKFASEG